MTAYRAVRLRLQIRAKTNYKWSGKVRAELQKSEQDTWNTNPFYHKVQSSAIIQILWIFVNVWGNVSNGFFCSGENNCVRFGKIASLFAFVLFAGGCVVRIAYESFLDFSFSEFFMLYRTANSSSLYFS